MMNITEMEWGRHNGGLGLPKIFMRNDEEKIIPLFAFIFLFFRRICPDWHFCGKPFSSWKTGFCPFSFVRQQEKKNPDQTFMAGLTTKRRDKPSKMI